MIDRTSAGEGRVARTTGRLRVSALAVAVAAVAVALVAAGCGGDEEAGTTAAPATETAAPATETSAAEAISFVYLDTSTTSFTVPAQEAVKAFAAENNATVDIFSADFDPQKQLSQCETAIATGKYQGLLIYPVDGAAAVPCAEAAIAAGLKVVSNEGSIGPEFFDPNGPQLEGVSGEVNQWPELYAKSWVEMALQACGTLDPCNLAMFTGPPEYTLTTLEVEALEAELANHPNLKLIDLGAPGFDAADAAAALTRTLLQTHPDTHVIISDDDATATGIVAALEELGKTGSVFVIGWGATEAAVERIKAGTQFGSVIAVPQTDVRMAAELLLKAIRGEPIEDPLLDPSETSPLEGGKLTLTQENVDQFTVEW
ncbi:MAG: sugar ABC transporter substrate-binding protein [Thermoleophilia bacterium]|nr:sugar ABC transporter substrate-binding protein [Thermoleophilia bacterium]